MKTMEGMRSMELYKTIRQEAEANNIIEKSKFIAHVRPVSTKEEADAFVAEIRGKYKDATHNVPAMVIGDKFQIQWASDDGEPQGTSGAPIVQMMVKEGITNVAVVVTRYFGGIKLGTGGLVRAYTGSAKLGLEAGGICSVREMCHIVFETEYTFLSKIQNLSNDKLIEAGEDDDSVKFSIKNIEYTDKVKITAITFPEKKEEFINLITNMTSGSIGISSSKIIREKV